MVEFSIKIHEKQGTAYFPKEIREAFGLNLKLLPNAEAGVFYRDDADLNRVIASVKILLQDLALRASAKVQGV